MDLILIGGCLVAIIAIYFKSNPLKHGRWFMMRRFINWFPLGMTYAFLCMGRYNLIVSKGALGTLMTKEDLGIIFAVGTWTYAVSFLINGPLIDKKLGGKRGIMVAVPRQLSLSQTTRTTSGMFIGSCGPTCLIQGKARERLTTLLADDHKHHHDFIAPHLTYARLPYQVNRAIFHGMNNLVITPEWGVSMRLIDRYSRWPLSPELMTGYHGESATTISGRSIGIASISG